MMGNTFCTFNELNDAISVRFESEKKTTSVLRDNEKYKKIRVFPSEFRFTLTMIFYIAIHYLRFVFVLIMKYFQNS